MSDGQNALVIKTILLMKDNVACAVLADTEPWLNWLTWLILILAFKVQHLRL